MTHTIYQYHKTNNTASFIESIIIGVFRELQMLLIEAVRQVNI